MEKGSEAWRKAVAEGKKRERAHPSDLRVARVEKDFTQAQMAKFLGVSDVTYMSIEMGHTAVTHDRAKKVAQKLSSSVDAIFVKNPADPLKYIVSKRKYGDSKKAAKKAS